MKTISKYYNCICEKKYQQLGFSRRKTTFVRMREDILQVFTLKFPREKETCFVEFGIFPLCLPQPIFLSEGSYELENFSVKQYGSSWKYDSGSEKSMMSCVSAMTETIDFYLIPFFEKCHNSESALLELVKLEELFDYNRKKCLQLQGEEDKAEPWQERSLFDYTKFYLALKSHNWIYVNRYLNYQVDHYKTSLKSFDSPNAPKQPDSVKKRFLDKLIVRSEQLEHLKSGDFNYFDTIVRANEKQMVEYLTANYPKVIKNR